MKLKEVAKILEARAVFDDFPDLEIKTACGADLMSDVLAFSHSKTLLLTGLTNPQVVRTAEMTDIEVICFVRGKKPTDNTIKLAKEKDIALFYTKKSLFESCGLLYKIGLKAEELHEFK